MRIPEGAANTAFLMEKYTKEKDIRRNRVSIWQSNGNDKAAAHSWVYVRQYCAKIDEAARNSMELIMRSLAKRNGVTEKLKADTKWNGYGR